MQSLFDGRYAVYMPYYSIGPMVNESCQMTRSNTRPSQARFRLGQVQQRLGPAKPGPAKSRSSPAHVQVQPSPIHINTIQLSPLTWAGLDLHGLGCLAGTDWTWSWVGLFVGLDRASLTWASLNLAWLGLVLDLVIWHSFTTGPDTIVWHVYSIASIIKTLHS